MRRGKLLTLFVFSAVMGAFYVVRSHQATAAEVRPVAGQEKTGIAWEIEPPEVIIFLDEKRLGEAGKVKFTDAKPGKHTVKLMNGKDETEAEVVVKKGQTLKFTFSFTGG